MNKKNIAPILAGLIIAVGTGVFVAHAVDYTPLAPLPGTFDIATGKTELSTYLSGMIKLLIALGAATAVLFAIIGGTQYVAASINPSAKKDALEHIWNALIGLAIMLTSYLLLNSINPELVDVKFNLPSVNPVVTQQTYVGVSAYAPGKTSCTGNADCNTSAGYTCDYLINESGEETGTQNCILSAASSQCNPLVSASGCVSGASWGNDSTIRNSFHSFITVSRPNNCTYVGESGCTSLTGLSSTVINGLEGLRNACNCPIKITGGTEYWLHGNKSLEIDANTTQHKPGGSVVDLSKSTSVTDYIIANGGTPTYETGCANGKHYKIGSATYVDETSSTASTGEHWHVCY